MMPEVTLESYLADNAKKNIIDFAIRASLENGKWVFYIHPDRVSGDTLDFMVEGNRLTRIKMPVIPSVK